MCFVQVFILVASQTVILRFLCEINFKGSTNHPRFKLSSSKRQEAEWFRPLVFTLADSQNTEPRNIASLLYYYSALQTTWFWLVNRSVQLFKYFWIMITHANCSFRKSVFFFSCSHILSLNVSTFHAHIFICLGSSCAVIAAAAAKKNTDWSGGHGPFLLM